MFIKINGCFADNKGAELMLLAIKDHVLSRAPDSRFAVTRWFGTCEQRAVHGLATKVAGGRRVRSRIA